MTERVRMVHHMGLIKVIVDGKVVLETNDYLDAKRRLEDEKKELARANPERR